MVKLICDFSFCSHYVENFFSDDNRASANIINKAISFHLDNNKILLIPHYVLDRLEAVYPGRRLVLETLIDVCEIVNIDGKEPTDTLMKIATISKIFDKETYIVTEDSSVVKTLKERKCDTEAISIENALSKIS
ncbi:hypothetical protein J4480_05700 [Candidatus Woesearchaeota archaeon]|nr:hypothetical protein [Candidatus Woesearchaeota archaeon]